MVPPLPLVPVNGGRRSRYSGTALSAVASRHLTFDLSVPIRLSAHGTGRPWRCASLAGANRRRRRHSGGIEARALTSTMIAATRFTPDSAASDSSPTEPVSR
jgi:hypothetical protein